MPAEDVGLAPAVPGFRPVGEERTIHRGHILHLVEADFEAPDGSRFTREVVHHPGAVSVVPLLDDGETVVCVRQYRAALDELLLEIPAGKLDVAGEDLEACAARELEEEVGLRATTLERLASFRNSAGFCDETSHVYLATGLVETATDLQGVEEAHMTVEHVSLADVPAMIADGRLTDAKTIIGLTLTRARLG
jgi:ADP-ribose pyrophosphatase